MQNEVTHSSSVTLCEVTKDTVRAITRLAVRKEQEQFVASNAVSIAQAYFHEDAWFRAIYADETPVGFVMLSDIPEKAEYFVWRFMIDAQYQSLGFGRRAMQLIIDHVKTRPNAKELFLSHREGKGNPGPFYEKLGFGYTGAIDDGERIMKLDLTR